MVHCGKPVAGSTLSTGLHCLGFEGLATSGWSSVGLRWNCAPPGPFLSVNVMLELVKLKTISFSSVGDIVCVSRATRLVPGPVKLFSTVGNVLRTTPHCGVSTVVFQAS